MVSKYDDMQKNLLPSGFAWIRDKITNIVKLIQARSAGYDAVDNRTHELVDEAIPSTTFELLPEWESVTGLPDPLIKLEEEQTEAQRRNAVLSKLVAQGSLSIPFLKQVALNYGYEIEIQEFSGGNGARCGVIRCGEPITYGEWMFVFNVISEDEYKIAARCGTTRCGDRLADYGDTTLQVVMRRHKPAHTLDVYNLYQ
jgi:uncharacterized protein YmfQ (DUF2313 family)